MRLRGLLLALAVLLPLAGCGELPEPFLGNPGTAALALRQPPEPRLAVPPPATALLSDGAARRFATVLAHSLRAHEVPAYALRPAPTDWRLAVAAADEGAEIVPRYTVLNPQGLPQGKVVGTPVSAAAWSAADPATLAAAADQAAPRLAKLLTGVEVALMRADPNSLYNRAARVVVTGVTGAPGNGDTLLDGSMQLALKAVGEVVQPIRKGADFVVRGRVRMVPVAGDQQRVEVQWIVDTAAGAEGGRVVQLHLVPAGSLDHDWGTVAGPIAEQAAGGVREVILRQSRRK
ncbi:MAG: hypothetical protein HIU82_03670 [Proteobacteria bacterium]|nr:hypothetical protein [Pseudomonadota bacterium]